MKLGERILWASLGYTARVLTEDEPETRNKVAGQVRAAGTMGAEHLLGELGSRAAKRLGREMGAAMDHFFGLDDEELPEEPDGVIDARPQAQPDDDDEDHTITVKVSPRRKARRY